MNPTGGYSGTYRPALWGDETLTYSGPVDGTGTFTFTDVDGSVYVINNFRVSTWSRPSGVVLTYTYNASGLLKSIFSTRGYALLFEGEARWTKACAVNLSEHHVTSLSACPASAPSVSYAYSADNLTLTGVTDALNRTTEYQYQAVGGYRHLSCIREPGASSCAITNQYQPCVRDAVLPQDPPRMHDMDRVIHQQTATGETYSYSYSVGSRCPPPVETVTTTMTFSDSSTVNVVTNEAGAPMRITDQLQRVTTNEYQYSNYYVPPPSPISITSPEGDRRQIGYIRGNVASVTEIPKPDSDLPTFSRSAHYSLTCQNIRYCNRPLSITDARGNTTDFTYDPVHGGVLTQMGPAVPTTQNDGTIASVRPQTRYEYAQRYAWISNGAGGHVQASTPIWVLVATSNCRTSAATGTAAAPRDRRR